MSAQFSIRLLFVDNYGDRNLIAICLIKLILQAVLGSMPTGEILLLEIKININKYMELPMLLKAQAVVCPRMHKDQVH